MSSKRPIRHIPPVATPRYVHDETKGDFTVLAYCGHSLCHPVEDICLSKKQHWYEVKCKCGNTEIINQSQLNSRNMCIECANVFKAERISQARQKAEAEKERPVGRPEKLPEPKTPAHLDFARMKLK